MPAPALGPGDTAGSQADELSAPLDFMYPENT